MLKRKKNKRDIGGESDEDQALEAGEEVASEKKRDILQLRQAGDKTTFD